MLYNRPTRGQTKGNGHKGFGFGSFNEEETAYEPNWAFLLDGENNVVRFTDIIAYVVPKDDEGETEFMYNGANFGKAINIDEYRKITIEDVASEVTKLVGKDNVTNMFYSNGVKLVYTGDKVAKDVDQLCMTVCNKLWIDVIVSSGGKNHPSDIAAQFGNLFFFVRTRANTFDICGTPCIEWKDFIEAVKTQFANLQNNSKKKR